MEMEMVEADARKLKTNLTTIEETMEVEDQDRISLLPDCLLVVILSLLGSTTEAIRTSAVSKRWQYLWTYVPNLIFPDFINPDDHLMYNFYSFVEKTLTQCRLSNLNMLRIRTRFELQFESQINSWIRYAVNRKVQDFHLALGKINHSMVFEFELNSDFFFKNSSFTKLALAGCSFNPPGVISWSKLTTFIISEGDLNEDLIQNLLSGCPLLETLEFHVCYGFRRIDISSKSVKNFVFCGYMTPGPDSNGFQDIIEINAPYITSLAIEGDLLLKNILLLNVSSLVHAHLDYLFGAGENDHTPCEEEEEEFFKGLLLGLRHVKEIEIGTLCSKVFTCLEAYGFIFPSNLKVVDPTPHYIYWSDSEETCDSEELLAYM